MTDRLLLPKGLKTIPIIFPGSDYASGSLTKEGDKLIFTHNASTMVVFRCGCNFGHGRTKLQNWKDFMTAPKSLLQNEASFRGGGSISCSNVGL